MRLSVVFRYVGFVILLSSIFLLISFFISVFYDSKPEVELLFCAIISFLFAVFPLIFVPPATTISSREGLFIVVISWLGTCLIGSLPYFLYGGEFQFINAIFESVSGFTTTGASILSDVEALPKGLLFWRSSTHWIGGVGIVLFVLVIVPYMGKTTMVLYNSEMSPLAKDNFHYRTKTALKILLWVYIGLTVFETLLLVIFGMNYFDAINHSFATIATGGFSTKNLSIAYYNSISIEIIIMIFMFLSGIHFGLLFSTLLFGHFNIFRSEVVRYYFIISVIGILFITIDLVNSNIESFWTSLRYASFQLLSLSTTTGFASADSASWPSLSKILLIFFTMQCACAGSTAGGIKIDRVLLFWKSVKRHIKKSNHPNAIVFVKLEKRVIEEEVISSSLMYIIFYVIIVFFSAACVAAMGTDIMTAISGAAATMGNVGPGFGSVSSMANYGGLPDAAKIIYSIDMLLGRLEIFAFISILSKK